MAKTKSIILIQGPQSGTIAAVWQDVKTYSCVSPAEPGALIAIRQGKYQQTGEYDTEGNEIFAWAGWNE